MIGPTIPECVIIVTVDEVEEGPMLVLVTLELTRIKSRANGLVLLAPVTVMLIVWVPYGSSAV